MLNNLAQICYIVLEINYTAMETPNYIFTKLKNWLLMTCLLVVAMSSVYSQLEISSVGSTEITVNGDYGVFDVFITNNYSTTQENIEVELILPAGINYLSSSLSSSTGHVVTETNLALGMFNLASISSGETATISFHIIANCDAIDYQMNGLIFRNEVNVEAQQSIANHISSRYNILYAALLITDITPNNVTLISGQFVTRTITIVNGGNGGIDNYVLTHNHGSEVTITSRSKGLLVGDTIIFSGFDFVLEGNGNGEFEQDEIMSFDVTYEALSCNDKTVTSTIKAGWLAQEGFCQNSQTFANTSIDFSEPNLKITTASELKFCLDESILDDQSVTIENKGSGVAAGIVVDIFKSSGEAYDQDLLSKFDLSSITHSLNGTTPVPMAAVSSSNTSNSGNLACLGSNAKGQFILNVEKMDPDDIVVVHWNMKTCEVNVCNGPSVGGWAVDLDYSGNIYFGKLVKN